MCPFLKLDASLRICYALMGMGEAKRAQAEAASGILRYSKLTGYFSFILLKAMTRAPQFFSGVVGPCDGWGNDLWGRPGWGGARA